MKGYCMENARLVFEWHETGMRLIDKRSGNVYEQRGVPGFTQINTSRDGFDLMRDGQKIACCSCTLGSDYAELTICGEGSMGEMEYPGPWKIEADDLCLYPEGSGICFSGSDLRYCPQEWQPMVAGAGLSMAMWGMQRKGCVMFTVLESCYDARLHTFVSQEQTVESTVEFLGEKGQWGYPRKIRFYVGDDLPAVCASIRKWREELGYVRSLKEKMKHVPGLVDFAGAADFWLWDDNNMNRLYGRPETLEETPRDVRRIAREMKSLGMDRVLWNSFEGETREDCDFLKSLGFFVGKYDIYRDVIPEESRASIIPYRVKRGAHHFKNWPDDVRIKEDGSRSIAWKLHTTDGRLVYQNAICDMCALKMMMEDVPEDIRNIGYNSRFIDVQGGSPGEECWNPLHPCTRRDSLRYVNAQTRVLEDMQLICGVEAGHEGTVQSFHFCEGTTSPFQFRQHDAGRRMTSEFYGDDIPKQIPDGMINAACRVPLWELMYHDCAVCYWYWGDSANCCPDYLPVRDLFSALWGYPPLYSMTATQWERLKNRIAESYRRAAAVARHVAFMPMTGFVWLTQDRMVQRTVFDGKITVTANFSDIPYTLENGDILPAGEYRMTEC